MLCHAPLISTYVRIYVHVHAARSHLSPSCALQAYDPRGTSECGIHMCVGAKSGENLACVSWIVRGISFRRRTAPFRRRRIEETCAEVPEPIPIARRGSPAAYDDVFNVPLTNPRNCADLSLFHFSVSFATTRELFNIHFINAFAKRNDKNSRLGSPIIYTASELFLKLWN